MAEIYKLMNVMEKVSLSLHNARTGNSFSLN